MELTYVLTANKNIKHGKYIQYYEYPKKKSKRKLKKEGFYFQNKKDSIWNFYSWNRNLFKTGYFKKGLKDGLWKVYLWNPKNLSSIGEYKNGRKTGVWKYYNEAGVMIHKFDHTDNRLLYYTKNELATSEQPNDLNKDYDNKGLILGGEASFKQYIGKEYEYPKEASWNGISGKVIVDFYVNEKFVKSNFRVKQNPGYGIGDEAIRLIEDGPLWIPPKKDGKFIGTKYSIPITAWMQ